MRLFVYGGTSYNVRQVIGDWKSFATHHLAESYGLEENAWSIGVGVFDKEPFLILRQLQRDVSNRECSFAILFDPGEDNWKKKFNWNPAFLAYTLLYTDDNLRENLVETPEKLNLEYLEQVVNQLPNASPEIEDELENKISTFRLLMAGSSFRKQTLTVKADDANLPSTLFTETTELPKMLDRMPPCFRCGNGWLLGGTKQLAQELGVNLLIDAGYQTSTDQDYENVKNKGKEVLTTWRKILKHEKFDWINALTQTPVFKWTNVPDNLMKRLELLVELHDKKVVSGDELLILQNRITNITEDGDLLLREFSNELGRLTISEKELSADTSQNWLDKSFTYKNQLPPSISQKLKIETYVEELVAHELEPNNTSLPKQLEPHQRAIVWQQLIEQKTEEKDIPLRLSKAIKDLSVQAEGDEQLQNDLKNLAQAAVIRTKNLWTWESTLEQKEVRKIAAEFWAERARKNFHPEDTTKVYQYLVFGEDAGGHWLSSQTLNADEFIKSLQRRIKDNFHAKIEAVNWLKDLAVSPFRLKLSISKKESLWAMEELKGSYWENFGKLKNLVTGKIEMITQKADEKEIGYLREELSQYFKNHPNLKLSDENERKLELFLGELPTGVKTQPNQAAVQAKQVAKQAENPHLKSFANLLESAIPFEANSVAREIAPNLLSLVQQIESAKQTKIDLAKAVQNLFNDNQKRQSLVENFSLQKSPTWLKLLDILPLKLQIEILSLADNHNHENFFDEAQFLFEQRNKDATKNIRGLWAYLLSEKGKKTIKELQKKNRNTREYLEIWFEKSQEDWKIVESEAESASFLSWLKL